MNEEDKKQAALDAKLFEESSDRFPEREASQEAKEVIEDLKREIASAKEHKHAIIMTTAFAQKIVNAMERACI